MEFGPGKIPDAREHRKLGIKNRKLQNRSCQFRSARSELEGNNHCTLRAPRGMPRGPGSIGSPPPPPLAPHLLNPCRSPTPSKTEGNTGSVQPWPTPTALSTCGKCCRGRGIARRSAPLYRTRTYRAPFRVHRPAPTPYKYSFFSRVYRTRTTPVYILYLYYILFTRTIIVTQAGGAARARRTCGSRPIY